MNVDDKVASLLSIGETDRIDVFTLVVPLNNMSNRKGNGGIEGGIKGCIKGGIKAAETARQIMGLIRLNRQVTVSDMELKIGISRSAIEKHLERLKNEGVLRRVGARRGGHWEILAEKGC